MSGGLGVVIAKRTRTWTLLHKEAGSVNEYYERTDGSTTELTFQGADVPRRGAWLTISDVGVLPRGEMLLYVDEDKLPFPAEYFTPQAMLRDEDGKEWGVVTMNRFGNRITPNAGTSTKVIELVIEKKGVQEE